ncbi:MAG: glucuronate isomerase [Oscillospiraceae bacterium]|jgi:glucuronate isomerase|nr:glucuronate isomerase [Oscillospiraceae bacterium]
MKPFMDDNFLLTTETARELFAIAQPLPICDFHCHISPKEVAENKPFRSITAAWLGGDHYKWRMMRIAGVPERYITGDASDLEKFKAYAGALQFAVGNPLYHWTHLELQRFFGIYEPLTARNAVEIYEKCNDLLTEGMRPQEIIARSNVAIVGTTDDPTDDLKWHDILADSRINESGARIVPSFRPDRAMNILANGFREYTALLGEAADIEIDSFSTLCEALASRIDYFSERGCRVSDHGPAFIKHAPISCVKADEALKAALAGKPVAEEQYVAFYNTLLAFLAAQYQKHGWTMCLHIGAVRNINPTLFKSIGADAGSDVMGDLSVSSQLAAILSDMASVTELPRTLLFSLNDKENYSLAVIAGALQKDGAASNVGVGPAWWYHDQLEGMRKHMKELAAVSVLSEFVGMTTDSRSFLSYPRHEYFRRIFCEQLGQWVENGEYPYDAAALSEIVRKVSCENALRIFQ